MANKFDIDPDLVKNLAGLLDETGLSEIEFESSGKRIRVARSVVSASPAVTVSATPPGSAVATEMMAAKQNSSPHFQEARPRSGRVW